LNKNDCLLHNVVHAKKLEKLKNATVILAEASLLSFILTYNFFFDHDVSQILPIIVNDNQIQARKEQIQDILQT